jgi:hypothetical protein
LTLRTAEKWRCRLLKADTSSVEGAAEAYEDGKAAFLLWSFDTDRDNNDERSGFFRCKKGRLKFQFDRRNDVSSASVALTAEVTLPARRFGLDHKILELYALSQLNGRFGEQTFFEERDHSPRLDPYKN